MRGECIMDPLCAAFSLDCRLMPTVGGCLGNARFRNRSVPIPCRLVRSSAPRGRSWPAVGHARRSRRGYSQPNGGAASERFALCEFGGRGSREAIFRNRLVSVSCRLGCGPAGLRRGYEAALGGRTGVYSLPCVGSTASGRIGSGFSGFSEGARSAKIDLVPV